MIALPNDRVLIIQPLPGIGDMVWNLPFIHAIAEQTTTGKITLLTKRRSRADQLLASDNSIEDIIWLERTGKHDGIGGILQLATLLRRQRFQIAWILHQSVRYALLAHLAGIPLRIGYGTGPQRWFLSQGYYLPIQQTPRHPIDAGQHLLQYFNIPVNHDEPYLPINHQQQQLIQQKWQLSATARNIILGIGSSEDFKVWPQQHFVQLMQRLDQRDHCRFYLLGGGEKERIQADWIEQQGKALGIDVVNTLAQHLSITEALHLCSLADLYIGNDTGFLNISAALAVPTIGIFGASPPLRHSRSIHAVIPPQGALDDYDRSGLGMKSISAEMVYQQTIERLEMINQTLGITGKITRDAYSA